MRIVAVTAASNGMVCSAGNNSPALLFVIETRTYAVVDGGLGRCHKGGPPPRKTRITNILGRSA
jgi:hypothetical protein